MNLSESQPRERAAMRLLQGYIWHPIDEDIDLEQFVPHELEHRSGTSYGEGAKVLWDRVNPPFAFFENGEPSAGQACYQLTVLHVYEEKPDNNCLHEDALGASQALAPILETTPKSVGWQLWEDLREL